VYFYGGPLASKNTISHYVHIITVAHVHKLLVQLKAFLRQKHIISNYLNIIANELCITSKYYQIISNYIWTLGSNGLLAPINTYVHIISNHEPCVVLA